MIRTVLLAFLLCCFHSWGQEQIVVVIDPGHGGKDYGRLASKTDYKHEKELNLDISRKLGGYLEKNLSHVKVLYTRLDDTYPTLTERVDFANSIKADYFISVHCNGAENNTTAIGTETHIHSNSNASSYQLASMIEKEFKTRAGRKSRGVKNSSDRHHSLQVLKDTKMTSVLVESGFMSNASEESYLNSNYGQEIIASAIFRAFRGYIKKKHPGIDFSAGIDDDSDEPQYRVQIMSSIEEVSTDIPEFKKLGMPVTRLKVESTTSYKYKYTVGKTDDKKEIKKILKSVKAKGFNDAFIVKY